MSPGLAVHVLAGSAAIVSGACAAFTKKGSRLHRLSGRAFVGAMLTMATLGGALALGGPLPRGAAPPPASLSVAALSIYLVLTGLLTVRRRSNVAVAWAVVGFGALIVAALVAFGTRALLSGGPPPSFAPYFAFALLAAFAVALDVRVLRCGGLEPAHRIMRHLWRMGTGWFFACAFFFLGQQKVMPSEIHGSPVLILAALLPIAVVTFWIVRIRVTLISAKRPNTSLVSRFALKPRSGRCAA